MQQNNFENQVQQKLSNREIKPSANSWDRLDAMLSVEEKPKKKGFFWVNIAASFIVLASIGYYFYNQNEVLIPAKDDSIIVEVEKKKEVGEEVKETRSEKQEKVLVENDNKLEKSNQVVNQKLSNTSEINIQELAINNQGVSNINQSKEDNSVVSTETKFQKAEMVSVIVSPEKLIAEVTNEKFINKSIENKKIKMIKKVIKVNPNSLLSNAESELNQTYRETAIEKLSKNYNSIKTVLANRNYEE
jgi:hypothetical protein